MERHEKGNGWEPFDSERHGNLPVVMFDEKELFVVNSPTHWVVTVQIFAPYEGVGVTVTRYGPGKDVDHVSVDKVLEERNFKVFRFGPVAPRGDQSQLRIRFTKINGLVSQKTNVVLVTAEEKVVTKYHHVKVTNSGFDLSDPDRP